MLRSASKIALVTGFLLSQNSDAHAQVAVDGTTSTNVAIGADGKVTVGIAPVSRQGISHNRYRKFNVPSAGMELDNRNRAARTIVNEVTGTEQTSIKGDVTVVGQKAHVIIANPNGIVIDGGRFVNTGRVALTTGKLSMDKRQIAPGIYQDNVLATVSEGKITIEGGGLTGQMDAVNLIAEHIKVAAPVILDDAQSVLSLSAGHNTAIFDSSVIPGNKNANWSNVKRQKGSPKGILVEILRPGVLQANRIGIEISGAGTGVRFAGKGLAGSKGFSINSDGKVTLDQAVIESKNNIQIAGASLEDHESTFNAKKSFISFSATEQKTSLFMGSKINTDILFMSSQGDLTFEGENKRPFQAKLERTAHFFTKGRLHFGSSVVNAIETISLASNDKLSFSNARIHANGHVIAEAADITLDDSKGRPELIAQLGSLILTTTDSFVNNGGLLQGGKKYDDVKTSSNTKPVGAVTLHIGGDFHNNARANHAVIFATAGDLVMNVSGNIENRQGRFLSNGMIKIEAGGDIKNLSANPANGAGSLSYNIHTKKRPFWAFWRAHKKTIDISYKGVKVTPDRLATITAVKGVSLQAKGTVLNHGGEINANKGDVSITARKVKTLGLLSGDADITIKCGVFCNTQSNHQISLVGGHINASRNIITTAHNDFENIGGRVFAHEKLEISANKISAISRSVPLLIYRPKGLYNFWSSQTAQFSMHDQYGTFISETSNIVLDSAKSIIVNGGELISTRKIIAPSGIIYLKKPSHYVISSGRRIIGIFNDIIIKEL